MANFIKNKTNTPAEKPINIKSYFLVNDTVKIYWTRHDSKLKSYGNRLYITNIQLEDMGKYYCIIYTKDNRRIEKFIDLKPEMFGFSKKQTKIADKLDDQINFSPTVEIVPIENDSYDLIQEFNCSTSELLLKSRLFFYFYVFYLKTLKMYNGIKKMENLVQKLKLKKIYLKFLILIKTTLAIIFA